LYFVLLICAVVLAGAVTTLWRRMDAERAPRDKASSVPTPTPPLMPASTPVPLSPGSADRWKAYLAEQQQTGVPRAELVKPAPRAELVRGNPKRWVTFFRLDELILVYRFGFCNSWIVSTLASCGRLPATVPDLANRPRQLVFLTPIDSQLNDFLNEIHQIARFEPSIVERIDSAQRLFAPAHTPKHAADDGGPSVLKPVPTRGLVPWVV
jgi:hypothetical protein